MKKTDNKRLVLLDSHAILHRAFHALPDFATSKGEPTGALYGLVVMLLKIVEELRPDYILACFDLPEPTYRHEAYDAYKAGRKKTDDALAAQIGRSLEVFEAFGIPVYSKPGFEADDMLGTIVERLKGNKDVDIVIASGDMDTLQLVKGKKVQVYTLKKGIKDTVIYDEKGVLERFGFGPGLIPDYKGLRGDPSDNIIGIPGIGEKTATELIKAFGSVEDIYKKLKKDEAAFKEAGVKPRIIELLKANEEEAVFSKMLATIRRDAPIEFSLPEAAWRDCCDIERVKDLFSRLEFRTLGSRVEAVLKGEAGAPAPAPSAAPVEQGPGEVIDASELEETRIALWLLDSNLTSPGIEEILRFANTRSFKDARTAILAEVKNRDLSFVYEEIERPIIPAVRKMEDRGVLVDTVYLSKLSKEYHSELDALERAIWEHAGGGFNVNSPKQLGEVLFGTLGLGTGKGKRTASGARSTKESELEKLRDSHPIIPLILEYREFQKLLSTYIDSIPAQLRPDGRLHAHFEQAGTTTGRMSSSNPNLQNIPIKSERGRHIRNAFVASPGHRLVAVDYSQIELRIAAFLSKDEKLVGIFKSGEDVHSAVASRVFGVPEGEVTKEMRRRAKVINFGILYGMGVTALRQNLGTDRKEAQAFYNAYFETFSTLAQYLDSVKAEAARKGYTTTFYGRRRYFEGIHSPIQFVRAAAERMAINAPIQGTEADLVKLAMRRIDERLREKELDGRAHLVLQVHDELVYEIEEDLVGELVPDIKRIMEAILKPEETEGVPILADAETGLTWGSMEEVD